ncbi:hypothetical protein LJR034_000833 [Caballeronia sp. LjRoot34]|uniref:hypothetical protein n=1 Tax=Caballeronia sp. LjRoot34 TaxID=3342325 RepID=UPI003ECE14FE
MPIENDFIPFAVGSDANVISQATYAENTDLTQSGFSAGIAVANQLNKVWRQSSIMAAVLAQFIVDQTGSTAIDDGTTATLLANLKLAVGSNGARVSGLIGINNSTTPLTQYNVSAASVTVLNPTTGATAVVVNTATITVNAATAGPVANGRDQSAAFTASQWLYLYFIYNPATNTLSTTISAATPAAGPALPTGYTAWAYIGTIYWNASSNFAQVYARGSWFAYQSPVAVLASGSATTNTPVSMPTVVPPTAFSPMFELQVTNISVTSASGGQYSGTFLLTIDNITNSMIQGLQGVGGASATFGISGSVKRLPNLSQGFSYIWGALGSSTGQSANVLCGGYSVSNGGE